jgi:tRNA threonylcarbamoyladenosine biosynthesis protein TsaE
MSHCDRRFNPGITSLMELLPPIDLRSEAATADLARRLGAFLTIGDVVALRGDLGAGKTSFARALIRALIGPDGADREVPSPTFTLVQTYETPAGRIHHFDLYRIISPDELIEIGWDEALADGIVLVEWPERAGALLPAARLDLTLEFGADAEARRALLRPGPGWINNHPGFAALQRGPQGE